MKIKYIDEVIRKEKPSDEEWQTLYEAFMPVAVHDAYSKFKAIQGGEKVTGDNFVIRWMDYAIIYDARFLYQDELLPLLDVLDSVNVTAVLLD